MFEVPHEYLTFSLAQNTTKLCGRGAMVAIELVHDDGTPDAERAKRICASCHEQGVIVLTAGTLGNVVRLLPPLVLDETLLDEGLDALDIAVRG